MYKRRFDSVTVAFTFKESEMNRFGPNVKVDVRYECNGCKYLSVQTETDVEEPMLVCSEPSVLADYSVPQFVGPGDNVHKPTRCPGWCPYVRQV